MSIGHSNVRSSIGRTEMTIGRMDEWTCLMATTLPIHMGSDSVRLRHYSFIGIVNVTCPLDINKCPFVHWTNRNVHWTNRNVYRTFTCPFVLWTNRNVHWTFKCPFSLDKQKCPLDIQMSIRPLDEQKYPLDIQMSIRPLDEWTLSIANRLVSNPHGVRLSQITSLQLPWHCKRYMSIGHK